MKITVTEEMREAAAEVILSEHLVGRARTEAEARHWSDAAERYRTWLGGALLKAIFPSPRSAPEIVEEMLAEAEPPDAMHVTVHMGTGRLECARCGVSARVALPAFASDFRGHLARFCDEHRECEEKGGGDA